MKHLTVALIKKHLNIDDYFKGDDEYIKNLGETAECMVDEHINNNLSQILEDNNGNLPAPILQAMLLLCGNLYQNREGIAFATASEIPHSYEYLLYPYKTYHQSQS